MNLLNAFVGRTDNEWFVFVPWNWLHTAQAYFIDLPMFATLNAVEYKTKPNILVCVGCQSVNWWKHCRLLLLIFQNGEGKNTEERWETETCDGQATCPGCTPPIPQWQLGWAPADLRGPNRTEAQIENEWMNECGWPRKEGLSIYFF